MRHAFSEGLFYPLYGDFDKAFFARLKQAIAEKYHFCGSHADRMFFVHTLLCFQMLRDYRAPLRAIHEKLVSETRLGPLCEAIRSEDFTLDYSWAVWKRDQEMGRMAEELFAAPVSLCYTESVYDEFVLRYLVSVWLVDWEGPLYSLQRIIYDGEREMRAMCELLAHWDFTGIFSEY